VTLSTASPQGVVSARTVLLKAHDSVRRRLVFETETYSRKGVELAANPHAAMTVYWREVHRQICVTGMAYPLGPEISGEMWAARGRPNQAASVAAREGEPIASVAEELELHAVADALAGSDAGIPRPSTYQAFGLDPATVEFWEGSADRLHRRVFYSRPGAEWEWRRIQP
jgi:pyridoxine/pyridoxamine 5'-phosphate oxidase